MLINNLGAVGEVYANIGRSVCGDQDGAVGRLRFPVGARIMIIVFFLGPIFFLGPMIIVIDYRRAMFC